jgi:acetyl esterase/lipase
MHFRFRSLLPLAALLAGGCTSVAYTGPPDPARIPEGIEFLSDLEYGNGGGKPLFLDLAHPKQANGPLPAVIFVHGGGWKGGARSEYHGPMLDLAKEGFVTVSIDYRLAPDHPFPAPLEDVKCAVRWVRANADKYNIDPNHIGAFGLSAGGHLVAMLGSTGNKKTWEGKGGNPKKSSAVQAIVCHAGIYDLPLAYEHSHTQNEREAKSLRGAMEALLDGPPEGHEAEYKKASPITYVHKKMPPVFLFHGAEDPLVPLEQAQRFEKRLRKAKVDVELLSIPGAGHNDLGPQPAVNFSQAADFLRQALSAE